MVPAGPCRSDLGLEAPLLDQSFLLPGRSLRPQEGQRSPPARHQGRWGKGTVQIWRLGEQGVDSQPLLPPPPHLSSHSPYPQQRRQLLLKLPKSLPTPHRRAPCWGCRPDPGDHRTALPLQLGGPPSLTTPYAKRSRDDGGTTLDSGQAPALCRSLLLCKMELGLDWDLFTERRVIPRQGRGRQDSLPKAPWRWPS